MTDTAAYDVYEREIILSELRSTLNLASDEEQFRTRLSDLTAQHRKFSKIQTKIEKTLIKAKCFDKEEQLSIRNEFNDCYFEIIKHSNRLKKSDEEHRRSSTFNRQSISLNNNAQVNKLPRLPLPSFSGEPTDWQSYYDLYCSLIHDNLAYTDVEKFRYLLLTLKNEPYHLIKSIPITEDNYTIAVDTLVSRYDNKRVIASKHINKILDLKPCSEKISCLRELLNIYQENIKALETMQFPVRHWSFMLLSILLRKIPHSVRKRFELSLASPSDIPNIYALIQFLERELAACEIIGQSKFPDNVGTTAGRPAIQGNRGTRGLYTNVAESTSDSQPYVNSNKVCVCCGDLHHLSKCTKFLNLTPHDRHALVQGKNVCINCLSNSHFELKHCKSNFVCKHCFKRHNSWVCLTPQRPPVLTAVGIATDDESTSTEYCTANSSLQRPASDYTGELNACSTASGGRTHTVLLSTALVNVRVDGIDRGSVRCMLDTGSQGTFITKACTQRLGLSRRAIHVPVFGIGDNQPVYPHGIVSFSITPKNKNCPSIPIDAMILSKLISQMPSVPLPHTEWEHIKHLTLADPNFHMPQPVEVILGADVLPQILLNNTISGLPGTPIAINSIFGYLLLGKVSFDSTPPRTYFDSFSNEIIACFSSFDNDKYLQRFSQLESFPKQRFMAQGEVFHEDILKNTFTHDKTEQSIVALPFKLDAPRLDESRDSAVVRFRKLEYRLEHNHQLKLSYYACLHDYLGSNNIELVNYVNTLGSPHYITRHCVIKDSSNTRTTVVFDAGSRSSKGLASYDVLLTGPKLHPDIIDVPLKFRFRNIAFTEDSKQIYRYILISKSDRECKRILRRFDTKRPIREYRLSKVIFCKLAVLGIWHSNTPAMIAALQPTDCHVERSEFDTITKVLGLERLPNAYIFTFNVNALSKCCTKNASSGWSSPIILYAWSNSSTVLSWLLTTNEWKTFALNRTRERLSLVPASCGHHVPSADNRAVASRASTYRGMLTETLIQYELWFQEPTWLSMNESFWPEIKNIKCTNKEKRTLPVFYNTVSTSIMTDSSYFDLVSKLYFLDKLILRFYNRSKKGKDSYPNYVTVTELQFTFIGLIKIVQNTTFGDNIINIVKSERLSNALKRLNRFLDDNKTFRLGGRFHRISVNYTGPFYVRTNKVSNTKTVKRYVAVFVCISFQAVHLEVVSLIYIQSKRIIRWRWIQQSLIREGTIVVVYDDNSPPLPWRLAHVHALPLGSDAKTRVVTLKCSSIIFKYAVVKTCPLLGQ